MGPISGIVLYLGIACELIPTDCSLNLGIACELIPTDCSLNV